MKRFFLDTTAWIDLLHRHELSNTAFRARTGAAVENQFMEVVISADIISELLNEKVHNQERFKEFVYPIRHITQNRVLLPFNYRIGIELVLQRNLEPHECFFPFNDGFGEIFCTEGIDTVPQIVSQQKKQDLANNIEVFRNIVEGLPELIGSESDIKPTLAEWKKHLTESADSWHDDFYLKLAQGAKGKRLRTSYSFFLFEMAHEHRLVDVAITDKQRSRLCNMTYDHKHYTDARACWCDYLVTDDKDLIEIAKTISSEVPDAPQPISFPLFVTHVNAVPWQFRPNANYEHI
jgi:hypothetical protein